MKKTSVIINAVLFIAVAVLYILFFTSKGKPATAVVPTYVSGDSTVKTLPIAYIDTDSLLKKYDFAIEENDKLQSKQESSRLTLAQKADEFQKDYVDFQKKLANHIYATEERAQQESQRLAKKQDDIRALEARLTEELYDQQQKINKQLKDSLSLVLKGYCAEKGFQLVFSNMMDDNILYAADGYNATNDVAAILNARYKKKK
ncbi:membrane protein [Bacteroidia bacterium]|nr:membrane protein [Bacteroidia bacterium]